MMNKIKKKKNVVLIGMPGAGKSTVGIVLAKMLGYKFLDSDLLIQEQEGKILSDLIFEHGIEGFIAIENRVNKEIRARGTVIATGGSVCYCDEALRKMKEDGIIVYLRVTEANLKRRLGDLGKRGVVIRKGSDLHDLYLERTPLYEKYADLTVNVSNVRMEEAIKRVYAAVSERLEMGDE